LYLAIEDVAVDQPPAEIMWSCPITLKIVLGMLISKAARAGFLIRHIK
jgi:hypothetical protein